jgi:glycosyltransferase involved in cell wall biosynthesis
VIPFYNEAERLGDCSYLEKLELIKGIDFIYVNDGSIDDTFNILTKKFPTKKIISYKENKGKGGAVREGLLYAISKGYNVVGFLDSDGAFSQSDVSEISLSAERLFNEDPNLGIIIGSRASTSINKIKRSIPRLIISKTIKKVIKWSTRELTNQSYDTQSGFKLMRASQQLKDFLERGFQTKWFFDVEIMIGMGYFGYTKEISLSTWRDVRKSHLGLGSIISVFSELLIISSIANKKYLNK